MTNKKCHQCGCTLDYDQGKSKCFMLVSIFPVYILMQFIDELGVLLPVLFVLFLLIGLMLYITLVPLVEKDKT